LKKESQNIEFKESWNDEYIKWICGFANAFGGTIYIGIKDNFPFRAGIIESWGRGILKIMKDCINYGLISPRYNTHFSGLQIILFYKNAAQKTTQKVAQKTAQKVAQKKDIVSIDFTDKIKKNESEKNGKKIARQNRQKILKIIQKNNQITSVQMANELDVSIRTIANYLSDLKKEKILKRIGPDKGGYWLIIE
jgi:ATP-dependent DNA helicase RecG